MKIAPFISSFKVRTKHIEQTPENLSNIVIELIHPKAYISYDQKCELVESTINGVKNEKYKTAKRYRLFIIKLINTYTSLEIDNDGFDILSESKLLDIILSTFQSEY